MATKSTAITVVTYALIGTLVAIVGGLSGWYAYIRAHQSTLQQSDTARGFNTTAPSFTGSSGSTGANVAGVTSDVTPVTSSSSGGFLGQVAALLFGANAASTATSSAYTTPRLWHAEKQPVAGFGFVRTDTGIRLYYVAEATGYIQTADLHTGETARLTSTLRPKIGEAFIDVSGGVVERSLDENGHIITWVANVGTTTASSTIVGSLLPKDIRTYTTDHSGTSAYTFDTATGTAIVIQPGTGKSRIATVSGIANLIIHLLPSSSVILTQPASDGVMGTVFSVGKDGSLDALTSGPGLTVAPSDTLAPYLYSTSVRGTLSVYLQPAGNTNPLQLPLNTIADKCAWEHGVDARAYCAVPASTPGEGFIDAWYQGAIHTDDTLWIIDPGAGSAKRYYIPSANGGSVDAQDLVVDPSNTYLAFRNAVDQSLWVLRIVQ